MKKLYRKASQCIGQAIANKLLLSKKLSIKELEQKVQSFIQNNPMHVERKFIKTDTDAYLDTIEISHPSQENQHGYLIFIWGRACAFEHHLGFMAKVATDCQLTALSFNFRGVGHSAGELYNQDMLIQDACFQVMNLIKKGIPAHNITLYGHSLGGAIATHVASLFHKEGFKISLFCDRTFNSLVDATISRMVNQSLSFRATLTEKAIRLLMKFGWEMPVVAAYESIPDNYKRNIVICEKLHNDFLEDLSIPYAVSLHKNLRSAHSKTSFSYAVKARYVNAHMAYLHCLLPLFQSEHTNALENLYEFIRKN